MPSKLNNDYDATRTTQKIKLRKSFRLYNKDGSQDEGQQVLFPDRLGVSVPDEGAARLSGRNQETHYPL